MEAPSLDLLARLESECERAAMEVSECCERCRADPGASAERDLATICAHFLNQCDRLCFYLLRSPDHMHYRARYLDEFLHFIEVWPEYAEHPDGFPSLSRIAELWTAAEPSGAPDLPGAGRASRLKAVQGLLLTLFEDLELRQWVAGNEHLEPLRAALPGSTAPFGDVVFRLVDAAERLGRLDDTFFDSLVAARPNRSRDIHEVRARVNGAGARPR